MATWIGLLRAVNVGGRNRLAMAALRELCEASGCEEPRTLLQSGNVVFRAAGKSTAIERTLEAATKKRLKLEVDYVVRSAAEWDRIVAELPLAAEAKRDPGHVLVVCLKGAPTGAAVEKLRAAIRGPEVLHAKGAQLYLWYPAGVGTSKLTGTKIETTLGVRGTARNWNTVLKLQALARE